MLNREESICVIFEYTILELAVGKSKINRITC